MISSLIRLEILPACFSGSNNLHRLHNWLRSDGQNIVFETPEAGINEPGDLIFL